MSEETVDNRFSVVILAAGSSSRLGRPKQLLPYRGATLVEHAAETALLSGAYEVVVVLGARSEEIRENLSRMPVAIVENLEWAEGMASSIRAGMRSLTPTVQCAVIALCDQPEITGKHLQDLAETCLAEGSDIVASSYNNVIGVPCAFSGQMFQRLLELSGDVGAREFIRSAGKSISTVAFEPAIIDVDTDVDSRKFLERE